MWCLERKILKNVFKNFKFLFRKYSDVRLPFREFEKKIKALFGNFKIKLVNSEEL